MLLDCSFVALRQYQPKRITLMNVSSYAPMKSTNHPVPSGDRLTGRLLFAVLQEIAGEANVSPVSEFRSYSSQPDNMKLKETDLRRIK